MSSYKFQQERRLLNMKVWDFKSLVLANEINLNIIAAHFGINNKYKWEDPLILSNNDLKGILRDYENKWVYLYYFGSLVFINMEYHEIQDIIKYIQNIDSNLKNNNPNEYMDEYKLEVDDKYEYALYNDIMTTNEFFPYHLDIISVVLAKSTSLKIIEKNIDNLLDNVENIMNYLDTGKFNMSDEQIAKTSAKILRFKYYSISYLMLLEKPKSAWDNVDIENFYEQIAALFEMRDRYEKISHKTEVLQDITDVFASITHEKRGTKLEILVVILIFVELLISLIQIVFRLH